MKTKKWIPVTLVIFVVLVIIMVVIGRKIYIHNLKDNVKISISSISMTTNLNKNAWWQSVVGQTAGDVLLPDADMYGVELSETEQQMQYDLNQFNVYQVDIVVKNATEDIDIMVTPLKWCKENAYIWVMDDAGLRSAKGVGSHTMTEVYFISKANTPEEIEQYLVANGIPVYVSIMRNDIHEITSYSQQIYFKN